MSLHVLFSFAINTALSDNPLENSNYKFNNKTNMTSASSTSARSLFGDSKMRLADRVQVNVNYVASLVRQIVRGSKSNEILMHSARNFALQEHAIDNTENNLKKLQLLCDVSGQHEDNLLRSCQQIEEVKEQVRAMQR